MKHRTYAGQVRCKECRQGMFRISATPTTITYRCANDHLLTVKRSPDDAPTPITRHDSPPPNNAA